MSDPAGAKVKVGNEAAERSIARYKRIFFSGAMLVVTKSVTVLTTVVSLPLTLRYLGAERFGMWMTISSLVSVITFADLGLGNGLVSAVSHRDGQRDDDGIATLVSSAFFVLLASGTAILLLFCAAFRFIPWAHVFSVQSDLAVREAGPATFVFVTCFCFNLPLAISQRVQMALQEIWLANIWLMLGSLLGLAFVILAIHFKAGLPTLTLAMYGAPVLVALASGAVEFGLRRRSLVPRWSRVSFDAFSKLFRMGATFFLLQVLTVLGLGIDNLIIVTMSGSVAVATYAVMARYAQSLLVVNVFLQPLWPAFGEALGRGDFAWARIALAQASKWTLIISSAIALMTFAFGRLIVRYWVGPSVVIPTALLFGIGTMIVVLCYVGVVATFMNNEGLVHKQVKIYAVTVMACLTMKVVFMRKWGISGIPWATSIAFGAVYCVFGMALIRRHLSQVMRPVSHE